MIGRRAVRALAVLFALAPGACSPPQTQSNQANQPPAAPDRLTRDWLVGYWAYEGNCGSRLETALLPEGRYRMGDGAGRWSLSENRLTVVEEQPPGIQLMQVRLGDAGTSTIRITAPGEIEARWEGGPASRFVRCD